MASYNNGANKKNAEMPAYLIFAEAHYKASMEERLISPKPLKDKELEDYHLLALQKALQLVADAGSLTESVRQAVKAKLDSLFTHYKEINLQKQNVNSPAIGIDLGTTYCCVAVIQNGIMKIIQNTTGETKTPSFVAFQGSSDSNNNSDTVDDDDGPVVGFVAKDMADVHPQTTIYDGKRMIGRQFDDPRLAHEKKLWPFEVKKNMAGGEILIKTGPAQWTTPEEIAAHLVKYIKRFSEDKLGKEVLNAVVAVPAYFNNRQRELTKKACKMAGLNVLQLINEPTAGAVAYNMHRLENDDESQSSSRNCLIFDLGGGTFDVAVLTMRNSHIHIKAVGGDSHLGGEDFDNNMVDYCLEEFKRQQGIDLTAGKNSSNAVEKNKTSKLLRRIKSKCEQQKQLLIKAKEVHINLTAIYGGNDLLVKITRKKFEELNLHLFQKCMDIVKDVMTEAGMQKEDIHDIVLVGGSSRIPKVQEMLSSLFGGQALCKEIEPDDAVAVGAATLAYYAQNPEVPNILIREPEFHSEDIVAMPPKKPNVGGGPSIGQGAAKPPGKLDLSYWIRKTGNDTRRTPAPGFSPPRNQPPLQAQGHRQPQHRPTAQPRSTHAPSVTLSEYLSRKILCNKGRLVYGRDSDAKSFFVALRGSQLFMWRAQNGTHSSEEHAAVLDLKGATCTPKEYLDSVRSFTLILPDSSEYQFIAKDDTFTQDWVSQIGQQSRSESGAGAGSGSGSRLSRSRTSVGGDNIYREKLTQELNRAFKARSQAFPPLPPAEYNN